jgi:hypothetical protein
LLKSILFPTILLFSESSNLIDVVHKENYCCAFSGLDDIPTEEGQNKKQLSSLETMK